jgi:hypothetical protein
MRKLFAITAALCAASAGCQHVALEHRTTAQASTLADLHHKEVLDNIAVFVTNPDAMPFYMTAGSANTSVDRSAGVDSSFGWSLFQGDGGATATEWFFNSAGVNPRAGGSTSAQWVSNAITNPVKLDVMRCVYQRVVNRCTPECETKLDNCFVDHTEWKAAMTPGWYGVGTKKDIPKDACHVGHHCGTYVWVTAAGMDSLTKVTLGILDIATLDEASLEARLDPAGTAVAHNYAEALRLSELMKNYPNHDDAGYKELKKKLDAALAKLPAPDGNKAPGQSLFKRIPESQREAKPFLPFTLRSAPR